ncbi:MAG: arabinofuranosidase catalytic domain-containing protein [Dolichospermum sp.]|jgi:hypothetical protein
MSLNLGIIASSRSQGAALLLDAYPGAFAAYSLRKLSTAYTGPAIRVRRSTDNTELNIGFNGSGVLDTTALLTFCGIFNGFVSIWYDQSGNGNNLFNTLLANQPQIVNAGVITYRNGKPYMVCGVQGLNFTNTITTLINQSFSFWLTFEKSAATNVAVLANIPGNSYHWYDIGTTQYVSASNTITISSLAANSLGLINIITNYSVGATMYRNSVSIGSRGPLTSGSQSTVLFYGTHPTLTFSEFVFYTSNKTSDKTGIDTNINSFYSIYTPTWSGNGTALLDLYPSSYAAYSLRNLSSTYLGPLIRVRRSSDNTEQDFYGTSLGVLDTSSLLLFCGGGNGFIRTWYDQSGNGRNQIQTVNANQPSIVTSGSIILSNGKPCISQDGVSGRMLECIQAFPISSLSIFQVFKINDTTFQTNFGGGSNYVLFGFTSSFPPDSITVSSRFKNGASLVTSDAPEVTTNYGNNTQILSSAFYTGAITWNGFGWGNSTSWPTTGNVQEHIWYTSSQAANRTAIETNINSYYTIY